jgi:hypothetical protein
VKTRVYVDLDIETPTGLHGGEDQIEGDVNFEAFRYMTWLVDDFLDGKAPPGWKGPVVKIQRVFAESTYPDPAGAACYIKEPHDCGIC